MRYIAAGQNVAEKNRIRAVGRLRFFVVRAALAAKHIQSCYVPFAFFNLLAYEHSQAIRAAHKCLRLYIRI
jgi:hypothetical protein